MAAPVQRRPRETAIAKLLLELATGRRQRTRWWAATRLGRLPARDDIDAALARAMRDDPSIATDAAMALAVHAPEDPRPIIAFARRAVDTLEDKPEAAAAVFAGCLAAAWEREPGVMLEVAALLDAAEARADIAAISGDIRHRIEALPPAGEAAPLWTLSDEKPSDWTSASW